MRRVVNSAYKTSERDVYSSSSYSSSIWNTDFDRAVF